MTSVVSFVFVGIVLAYLLLVLALSMKDYPIGMLSSLTIMSLGIYIAIYNIEGINNILTQTFGLISICIGAYVFINGSIEKIKEFI